MIRPIRENDAKSIADIYNYYIKNTVITFENDMVSEAEIKKRIKEITANLPWIVYESNNEVIGYAYASNWKSRCAYKNSVEATIYLKYNKKEKGVGTLLYNELLKRIKAKKFHTVIGGIALPNEASIALHEKLGFKKVAHFKEVGYKFDKWIDVAYWQLILNNKSRS